MLKFLSKLFIVSLVAVVGSFGLSIAYNQAHAASATSKTAKFKFKVYGPNEASACTRSVKVTVFQEVNDTGSLLKEGKKLNPDEGTCKKVGKRTYSSIYSLKVSLKPDRHAYAYDKFNYQVMMGIVDIGMGDVKDNITLYNLRDFQRKNFSLTEPNSSSCGSDLLSNVYTFKELTKATNTLSIRECNKKSL